MNMILSLVLSLALAFSGAARLPAVPETAETYTLSDVSLTYNDETFDIGPALRLTTALGSEQINFGVSAEMDGEGLLPISGQITADGVAFSLTEEGKVYTADAATLDELLGVTTEGDVELAFGMIGRMLAAAPELSDPQVGMQLSGDMIDAWIEKTGTVGEDCELTVADVTVPARKYEMELSGEILLESLDVLLASENAAVQDMGKLFLEILHAATGTEYASYTELVAAVVAEDGPSNVAIPLTIITGEQDGAIAHQILLEMADEYGTTVRMDVQALLSGEDMYEYGVMQISDDYVVADMEMEAAVSGDEGSMHMQMDIEENEGMTAAVSLDGAYNADGSFGLSYSMNTGSSFSYDAPEDGSEEEAIYTVSYEDSNITSFDMEGAQVDGLLNCNINFYNGMSSYYDDGAGYTDEGSSETTLSAYVEEEREDDGSVTADCEISVAASDSYGMDENMELSFKINRAEGAFADPFAGRETMALTANVEDTWSNDLMTDVMALASDLMALASDDGIIGLMNLIAPADEYTYIEAYDGEEYPADEYAADVYDGEYTGDEEYYEANGADNIDAAKVAEAYGHPIPDLAVPEGFVPEYVYAGMDYLNLDFYGEDGYISFTVWPVIDYGAKTMELLPDGTLKEAGRIIRMEYDDDGSIMYVSFSAEDSEISIYLSGVSEEEVLEILKPFA